MVADSHHRGSDGRRAPRRFNHEQRNRSLYLHAFLSRLFQLALQGLQFQLQLFDFELVLLFGDRIVVVLRAPEDNADQPPLFVDFETDPRHEGRRLQLPPFGGLAAGGSSGSVLSAAF
jgi:hypothetical protein